jgi:hypothetical protein
MIGQNCISNSNLLVMSNIVPDFKLSRDKHRSATQ